MTEQSNSVGKEFDRRKFLKAIYSAIINLRQVEFSYRNAKGEFAERTVEPMTLLFKGYTWYLYAFCRLKSDYRIFRLSRIRELKIMDAGFTRRDKSYDDLERQVNDKDKKSELVKLQLKFKPEARVRVDDFFDDDIVKELDNGDLFVEVSFPEDEWVYSFILGYGESVEVLGPRHVRKIIREKAERIYKIYQGKIEHE